MQSALLWFSIDDFHMTVMTVCIVYSLFTGDCGAVCWVKQNEMIWRYSSLSSLPCCLTLTSFAISCLCYFQSLLLRPWERLRSIVMSTSVCVCLSVCEDVSGTTRAIFTNVSCMLLMAVARSSFGVVVIRYVLPVLSMTLCFFYNGPYN